VQSCPLKCGFPKGSLEVTLAHLNNTVGRWERDGGNFRLIERADLLAHITTKKGVSHLFAYLLFNFMLRFDGEIGQAPGNINMKRGLEGTGKARLYALGACAAPAFHFHNRRDLKRGRGQDLNQKAA